MHRRAFRTSEERYAATAKVDGCGFHFEFFDTSCVATATEQQPQRGKLKTKRNIHDSTANTKQTANIHDEQEKGVDTVACMAVNDAFVMSRWIKSLDAEDKVTMLADGGAVFAEESGLCVKTGKFGGTRLQRLAMIVSIAPAPRHCLVCKKFQYL